MQNIISNDEVSLIIIIEGALSIMMGPLNNNNNNNIFKAVSNDLSHY